MEDTCITLVVADDTCTIPSTQMDCAFHAQILHVDVTFISHSGTNYTGVVAGTLYGAALV